MKVSKNRLFEYAINVPQGYLNPRGNMIPPRLIPAIKHHLDKIAQTQLFPGVEPAKEKVIEGAVDIVGIPSAIDVPDGYAEAESREGSWGSGRSGGQNFDELLTLQGASPPQWAWAFPSR